MIGYFEGIVNHICAIYNVLTLSDCNINAIHAKRVTIQYKDSRLARRYYHKFGQNGF
jgi:histone H3/H4